jgi:hypothetical protein
MQRLGVLGSTAPRTTARPSATSRRYRPAPDRRGSRSSWASCSAGRDRCDEIEGRYARLGDFTVSFETIKQDVDPAPYFVGLPVDRCQCAHWGVVTEGQLTFRWPDGLKQETYAVLKSCT